jgi:hypothetical protein
MGTKISHTSTPKNERQARQMQQERRAAAAKPAPSTPPPAPSSPRLVQTDISIDDPEEVDETPEPWTPVTFTRKLDQTLRSCRDEWEEHGQDLQYFINYVQSYVNLWEKELKSRKEDDT